MSVVAVAFFIIALIYSSVGFGGGSSYTAILILSGLSPTMVAPIALASNIVVVSGNSYNYFKEKTTNSKLFWQLAISSVPLSYIGGVLKFDKTFIIWTLITALFLSGIALFIKSTVKNSDKEKIEEIHPLIIFTLGGILGLVAGITGIGGGIFLAPILFHLKAANAKEISATSSLFILVNSLSGLLGQLQKANFENVIINYWYLPLLVFFGGQIGNRLSLKIFRPKQLMLVTSMLVIFASLQLLQKQLEQ